MKSEKEIVIDVINAREHARQASRTKGRSKDWKRLAKALERAAKIISDIYIEERD